MPTLEECVDKLFEECGWCPSKEEEGEAFILRGTGVAPPYGNMVNAVTGECEVPASFSWHFPPAAKNGAVIEEEPCHCSIRFLKTKTVTAVLTIGKGALNGAAGPHTVRLREGAEGAVLEVWPEIAGGAGSGPYTFEHTFLAVAGRLYTFELECNGTYNGEEQAEQEEEEGFNGLGIETWK